MASIVSRLIKCASRYVMTLTIQNKITVEEKSSFTFEDALALVGASEEVVLA